METQELIQQLSNTGNALWEASLKQNTIEIFRYAIASGIFLFLSIIGAFIVRWAIRHDRKNVYDDYTFPALMVETILLVSLFLVILIGTVDIVTILGNPEWAAAERIIEAIGN